MVTACTRCNKPQGGQHTGTSRHGIAGYPLPPTHAIHLPVGAATSSPIQMEFLRAPSPSSPLRTRWAGPNPSVMAASHPKSPETLPAAFPSLLAFSRRREGHRARCAVSRQGAVSIWRSVADQDCGGNRAAIRSTAPGGMGVAVSIMHSASVTHWTWFVKTNAAASIRDVRGRGAQGLGALAASRTLRCHCPQCTGIAEGKAPLSSGGTWKCATPARRAGVRQGTAAAMHRHGTEQFGWARDNTIGATRQCNSWDGDWVAFWREHRLGFQLAQAARNGHQGRLRCSAGN